MDAVHQFIPSFARWDAISAHVRHLQRLVRQLGLSSEIYCDSAHAVAPGEAHYYRDFRADRSAGRSWLLYQLSTGSRVAHFLQGRPEPKVVNYHNITPAEVFGPWEPVVGVELRQGRAELHELAEGTELGIADSPFNQSELRQAGYRRTVVAPPMVDLEAFDREVDPATMAALEAAKAGGGVDWLFVGRVAPHKCQHDVVKAFAVYRRLYDPKARLHLVGGSSSHAYWTALEAYLSDLDLSGAVKLHGAVSPSELAAHFLSADVFVCLSQHEGFCVPLLEAMHHGLPIVAYDAGAVADTMEDGGLLLVDKSPAIVAAAVERVLINRPLRDLLLAGARRRAADLTLERSRDRWVEVLRELMV